MKFTTIRRHVCLYTVGSAFAEVRTTHHVCLYTRLLIRAYDPSQISSQIPQRESFTNFFPNFTTGILHKFLPKFHNGDPSQISSQISQREWHATRHATRINSQRSGAMFAYTRFQQGTDLPGNPTRVRRQVCLTYTRGVAFA